jgi:hypothetical protein
MHYVSTEADSYLAASLIKSDIIISPTEQPIYKASKHWYPEMNLLSFAGNHLPTTRLPNQSSWDWLK